MSTFIRPFDPSSVIRLTDMIIRLPDPPRSPGEPVLRPRIARYAGGEIVLLHVTKPTNEDSFNMSFPVRGTVRNVDLSGPLPGGVNEFMEISPLPFGIEKVLFHLKAGFPTFYLGLVTQSTNGGGLPTITDHALIDQGWTISCQEAYVGVLFQDRVALSPWGWIEMIGRALEGSHDDGASSWNSLASLYSGVRSLRTVDHVGSTLFNQNFQIRIRKFDGTFEGPWVRNSGNEGDLELAANADPLPRQGGLQNSLFGVGGEQTELLWIGDASHDDISLPMHVYYETGSSRPPGEPIILDEGKVRGHLQTTELTRWLAPRTTTTVGSLARYHLNSRVEPIVDGRLFFKKILRDLEKSASSEHGAHFSAGWVLEEFPLEGNDEEKNTLTDITQKIIANGGDVRYLANKFVNFKQGSTFNSDAELIINLLFFSTALGLLISKARDILRTDKWGWIVFLTIYLLWFISNLYTSPKEKIVKEAEPNLDIVSLLNTIKDNIAIWAPYPARLTDNPLLPDPADLPLHLEKHIDQYGLYHQKFQLVKRTAYEQEIDPPDPNDDPEHPDTGSQYVAYLGGMDINHNRLDTPGHQVRSPYHDIHARITGPGAADVFKTWDERYLNSGSPPPLNNAFTSPNVSSLPERGKSKHVVQIARTYFKPNPTGANSEPLPFAPNGESLINDTLIRAIKSAREYIYIEDQYFIPNDSQPPGMAETVFDALLAAGEHSQSPQMSGRQLRLLIITPIEIDQPFGDRQRKYLFDRLLNVWGDRVLVGTILRRPILSATGPVVSEGRCYLTQDVTESTVNGVDTIYIGPRSRVPEASPFWLWIDGELMFSFGVPRPVDPEVNEPNVISDLRSMEVDVLRGQVGTNPRWGATTMNHKKGTAVTLSQLRGIFVHSKIMIIDDVFVSIGSANLDRRGLYHDGELNVFAVPEQLKASSDNPARALRTSLWAEHLGLVPSMGASLLGDPISSFELFRRSRYIGNRFTPLNTLDLKPYLTYQTSDAGIGMALSLIGVSLVPSQIRRVWNALIDPTSFSDSTAWLDRPGPE